MIGGDPYMKMMVKNRNTAKGKCRQNQISMV